LNVARRAPRGLLRARLIACCAAPVKKAGVRWGPGQAIEGLGEFRCRSLPPCRRRVLGTALDQLGCCQAQAAI